MAGQQHVWEMTHDIYEAGTVFTHQPLNPEPPTRAADHDDKYWIAGVLPRVLQFGVTVIAMYNPEDLVEFVFRKMNMTHAHFKWDTMDEVDDQSLNTTHWVFGRDGNAYSKHFMLFYF